MDYSNFNASSYTTVKYEYSVLQYIISKDYEVLG